MSLLEVVDFMKFLLTKREFGAKILKNRLDIAGECTFDYTVHMGSIANQVIQL